jgi:hypothetical protein
MVIEDIKIFHSKAFQKYTKVGGYEKKPSFNPVFNYLYISVRLIDFYRYWKEIL